MADGALKRYEFVLAKGGGTAAWAGCADALAQELKAARNLLREAVRDMEMDLAHPNVEVDTGSLLARMREAI